MKNKNLINKIRGCFIVLLVIGAGTAYEGLDDMVVFWVCLLAIFLPSLLGLLWFNKFVKSNFYTEKPNITSVYEEKRLDSN